MSATGRVLIVSPGYPPSLGGVEGHVAGLATRLVDLGWQVEVITARRGVRGVRREERDGVRVTVLPAWGIDSMSVSPRLLWRALRARDDYDVVHVHSYHALSGLAALRRRRRLVFTPHYHGGGHSPLARILHRVHRFAGRRCFANADAVICVSAAERALVEADHRVAAGKITVIPNGVDVDAIAAAEPFAVDGPIVLSLGRVEPYKHVDTVARACRDLAEPARLVVVGGGSALDDVRRAADPDRSDVLGPVSSLDVVRWLRTATVLVSVSDHEAFGMAPLEAAAAGARVVLSDIPAHREIRDAYLTDRATLVGDPSPATLTAAIEAAIAAGPCDPARVPTWRDVAEATIAVYLGAPASIERNP